MSGHARPIEQRFWAKVGRDGSIPLSHPEFGICWDWQGSPNGARGYGQIMRGDGELIRAHRFAWEVSSGEPVPDDKHIMHTCDRHICVRNDDQGVYDVGGIILPRYGHLVLGTSELNRIDMWIKRRGRYKLIKDEVLAIRAIGNSLPQRKVASMFKVSHSLVSLILSRQVWADVD
jgi:hypothetical protein